jgi:ElaB/YqjD/DUF883 family membrane-anchored ribosome-binding protein
LDEAFENKNKPEEEKIEDIIETVIKSNMANITLRYQENMKDDLEFYLKDIAHSYKTSINPNSLPVIVEEYNFDFDRLFGDGFISTLAYYAICFGNGVLILPLIYTLFTGKLLFVDDYMEEKRRKQINEIMQKLDEQLQKLFLDLESKISLKLLETKKEVLEKFDKISFEPYKQIKSQIENLTKDLSKQIKLAENSEADLNAYRDEIKRKKNLLVKNISQLEEL